MEHDALTIESVTWTVLIMQLFDSNKIHHQTIDK